jgi:hypothetical protein
MTMDAAGDKRQLKLPERQQPASVLEIRKEITTLIKSNAVNMVQKTIDQVNEGVCHEIFV